MIEDIGNNIRKLAKQRGIKLAEMAEAMQILPSNLPRVIDNPDIKVQTVYQIAEILKCSVTVILGFPTVKVSAENPIIKVIFEENKERG